MQVDNDQELEQEASTASVWLKRTALLLGVIVIIVAVGYGLKGFLAGGEVKKKNITKISLKDLPPPPPPPPPPPKEQPKDVKDQPKEVKVEQPKPAETPPAEQLKMEGAAGDGPSPFAAGSVKDEYKGGDIKTIGSADGGAKFNWYADKLNSHIQDVFKRDKTLSTGKFTVALSVWLNSDGSLDHFELKKSTGNDETDRQIKSALSAMPPLKEAMPEGMKRRIDLLIKAKEIG